MNLENLYQAFLKVSEISTDSRKITKNCLFFALKGENFNGNLFAKQAIKKGAAYVVIDEKNENLDPKKIFLVDNVLYTLQQLAKFHRQKLKIPILAISGSNGKTTTKELIAVVLNKKFNTYYTSGNFNNHIGVPLSLLSIKSNHQLAIIEMGANHIGEIATLCEIAMPNYGLLTNIGKAHLEGFGSVEGIIKGKSELYDWIKGVDGTVFVNADSDILMKQSAFLNRITYSKNLQANLEGSLESSSPLLQFAWNWSYKDKHNRSESAIISKLFGIYNYDNLLAACCIGNYFGISANEINEALSSYTSSINRSQIVKSKTNIIYLDAYNANPSSMEAALNSFNQIEAENKIVILGDMLELGQSSINEHRDLLNKLQQLNLNKVYLVGKIFYQFRDEFNFYFFEDRNYLEDILLKKNLIKGSCILIKGSRGNALEKLLPAL